MSIGVSIIAVIYGLITISWINKQPAGSDKMREISDAIAGKLIIH
jgi:K(+)-stimulated pyrophosphate-energized sodium pump